MAFTEDKQIEVFGETIEEMKMQVSESFINNGMLAMSVLSDAQHLLENCGHDPEYREIIRKYLNKAKFFISEASDRQREKEVKAPCGFCGGAEILAKAAKA